MTDFGDLVPLIAAKIGLAPSTLILFLFILVKGANIATRVIPDDATGFAGYVRRIAAVIGLYVPTRITSDATVTDVAKAALKTPPIPQQVEAAKDEESQA